MTARTACRSFVLIASAAGAFACAPADDASEAPPGEAAAPELGVVDIVARGLSFEAPETVRPGWTTFRFVNESPMVHFAIVERLPEGIGVDEQQTEVAPPFQAGMDAIVGGDMDAAMAAFGELPAWFGDVRFMGGPGLTGPGVTSEATVELEPGTYLLECYVKTGEVFHSFSPDPAVMAMVVEFTVEGEPTGVAPPAADHELMISSASGFTLAGTPMAGRNTFRVSFEDQATYANFVGHDVHVVRLDEGVSAADVDAWMNWSQPGGLNTPAPAVFVGGLNDMSAGDVGYFTVTLEPGSYGLLAEVPDPADKGMVVTFEVPEAM